MHIVLNGEPREVNAALTVADLVDALALGPGKRAIECNGQIVPVSRYPDHRLGEGDVVEIIQAVGGG
jgi:sulfur carrier protein